MSDSQLTLYYLPFRARAEAIRMILEYAGIQYQDVTVSMKDWMGIKGHTEIAPFDQLPSMRLPSGEIIAETGAIVRLVAKLARIYPEDPFAAARADMVYEFAMELNVINPLLNFWCMLSEPWQTNYASFFQNLPRNLNIIQGMLGDQAFFGGPTPHHGDFAIFHILDTCLTVKEDSTRRCWRTWSVYVQFLRSEFICRREQILSAWEWQDHLCKLKWLKCSTIRLVPSTTDLLSVTC